MILAMVQAATAPHARPAPAGPPAIVERATADGGFAYTVVPFPADKLSAVQDMLDAAAAKHCARRSVVPGGQSYDQSTSSEGLAAPTILHLRMSYKCA